MKPLSIIHQRRSSASVGTVSLGDLRPFGSALGFTLMLKIFLCLSVKAYGNLFGVVREEYRNAEIRINFLLRLAIIGEM